MHLIIKNLLLTVSVYSLEVSDLGSRSNVNDKPNFEHADQLPGEIHGMPVGRFWPTDTPL